MQLHSISGLCAQLSCHLEIASLQQKIWIVPQKVMFN